MRSLTRAFAGFKQMRERVVYNRFHTDFRRVYATLLDGWLGCDSKTVLGAKWDHIKELEPKV